MIDKNRVIKDLEWILEDDRFGFGANWLENLDHDQPECEEEWAGLYIEKAIAFLKEQPEIVRCKDCKHSMRYCAGEGNYLYGCEFVNGLNNGDWFCADGVRKDG